MKFTTGIKKGKIVDEEIFNEGLKYFEGKRVVLRCDEYEEKRTLDQNNALWRWNELLSKETGHTPKEMHYLMLKEVYGVKDIVIHDKETGEVLAKVEVPNKTSSDMSTKFFSDYVPLYFNKAQELFNYELPPFGWEQ